MDPIILALIKKYAGGILPEVSAADKGKVLAVNNSGVWREQEQEFIVRLTPTSESGGTMDKSNIEILAAYMQGKRIMFDIVVGSAACRVQATLTASFEGAQYPTFSAYGIDTSGTTIINLYVDPSDEESYTFTMDAVEINKEPNFVVTLTPTALDYSGTMDKTVSEIYDAYLAGKNIFFEIYAESMRARFPLVDTNKHDDYAYPSFDAVLWNVIDKVFMHVSTSFTNYGDKDTYSVSTFPMTYDSANGVSF